MRDEKPKLTDLAVGVAEAQRVMLDAHADLMAARDTESCARSAACSAINRFNDAYKRVIAARKALDEAIGKPE